MDEKNINDAISKAIEVLNNGGLVIYPTETTYGIGADASNQDAINKLLLYKERKEGMPIALAVASKEIAENYVELNSTADNIYKNFLPGPITVISKSLGIVAKGIESEKSTLGIRIPDFEFTLNLLNKFGKAITATSATNPGRKFPYSVTDILNNTSKKQQGLINLVLDVGELAHNNPSTVIDTLSGEIETVRIGDKRFDLKNKIISTSPEMTKEIGAKVAQYIIYTYKEPVIIAIQGQLGAGKTHFAGGLAKEMGVNIPVKSPTYSLVNEYELEDKKILYHIDTYRMESAEELLNLGFEEMLRDSNIVLIEWADKVLPVLDTYKDKYKFIWLKFEYLNDNERSIHHELDI